MVTNETRAWSSGDWANHRSEIVACLDAMLPRLRALDERTLRRQMQIASVAAPTGAETARATMLTSMLQKSRSVHVRQDGAGNVIARIERRSAHDDMPGEGERAPVVVMAHLDTVFGSATLLCAHREGAVVHCPGISDNGRGLAVLVELARLLGGEAKSLLQRPVELVATVGEEGDGNLRGARRYFDDASAQRTTPHAVLVLDGPGDRNIVHHAVASLRVRLEFSGTGGHSWVERSVPNPVHAAARAIAKLAEFADTLPREAAMTVTRMGGGERLTAVAEHAWFDVDIRARTPGLLRVCEARIASVMRDAGEGLRIERRVMGERPGGTLDWNHPLVRSAAEITEWCGAAPVSAMASTDANIPLSRGIPAIAIGAGGSGGAEHTTGEWYDNTNGPRGVARAMGIVLAMAAD